MTQKVLFIANELPTGPDDERTAGLRGYDVQFCQDPAVAIETATVGDFQAVLLGECGSWPNTLDLLRQFQEADVLSPVIVLASHPTVEAAVQVVKEGAADYLRAPCSAEELQAALRRVHAGADPAHVDSTKIMARCHGFEGILGRCLAMREVFALVERIAPADSTVLVAGESGTGKEMVVRAIHRQSRRRDFPLLACDCTALAPTLLESELFGHVKGSFSGAIATKQGLFEVAHRGTLLLDEVANLSLETQGKLLRVLESRRVRKVGDTAEHEVDIRLIATTNRSLAEMVKTGAFRADLYYRLNVVPISLPPLRERPGDVGLLALCFLRQFARQMGVEAKGFSPEALRQMEVYAWPGNVRELRNIVERLSVLYGACRIEVEHLPWEVREAEPRVSTTQVPCTWEEFKILKRRTVEDLERQFLIAALDRSSQNITQAAENVGMKRPNFHALLRSHGLKPQRGPAE
jgi:DNA-binding NtrC family response regulator